jgi:hypothetical protein
MTLIADMVASVRVLAEPRPPLKTLCRAGCEKLARIFSGISSVTSLASITGLAHNVDSGWCHGPVRRAQIYVFAEHAKVFSDAV